MTMSVDMNYERARLFAMTGWKRILQTPLFALQGYILSPLIGLLIKAHANKCSENVECLVKLAYSFGENHFLRRPFTIKSEQIYMEILSLAKMIHKLKPKTVVEIGTARGGTLFLWCRLAPNDATIISVDLPGGPFGGGYPSGGYRYISRSLKRGREFT